MKINGIEFNQTTFEEFEEECGESAFRIADMEAKCLSNLAKHQHVDINGRFAMEDEKRKKVIDHLVSTTIHKRLKVNPTNDKKIYFTESMEIDGIFKEGQGTCTQQDLFGNSIYRPLFWLQEEDLDYYIKKYGL